MLRGSELTTPVSTDQVDSLRAVFQVIRARQPVGRPEIARTVELGRAIVGVRVSQLMELGLIREKGFGASSGGRRAMDLELVRDAGYILTADLGATSITTAAAKYTACSVIASQVVNLCTVVPSKICAPAHPAIPASGNSTQPPDSGNGLTTLQTINPNPNAMNPD